MKCFIVWRKLLLSFVQHAMSSIKLVFRLQTHRHSRPAHMSPEKVEFWCARHSDCRRPLNCIMQMSNCAGNVVGTNAANFSPSRKSQLCGLFSYWPYGCCTHYMHIPNTEPIELRLCVRYICFFELTPRKIFTCRILKQIKSNTKK